MSGFFTFVLIIQTLVAVALISLILMQRSEGGGLGVGGSPSGLMSARGAANLLTRATAFLAIAFVSLSVILAAIAVGTTSGRKIDTSLQRSTAPAAPADPLAAPGGAAPGAAPASGAGTAAPAAPAAGAADPFAAPTKK